MVHATFAQRRSRCTKSACNKAHLAFCYPLTHDTHESDPRMHGALHINTCPGQRTMYRDLSSYEDTLEKKESHKMWFECTYAVCRCPLTDTHARTATKSPCAELPSHEESHELPEPIVLHLLAWRLPLGDPQVASLRCSGHQHYLRQTGCACVECSKDLICEQQGLQRHVQCQHSPVLPCTLLPAD